MSGKTKKKLLMVANVDWFFISHRLCIAEKAKKMVGVYTVPISNVEKLKDAIEVSLKSINESEVRLFFDSELKSRSIESFIATIKSNLSD